MAKVLIVEDDIDLVETYTDLLEANNYAVTSTGRALDAISLVTRLRPQIVILDLNLAGHSGTVVINVVRNYRPLKDTKIVVVTGHSEMIQAEVNRADFILQKPVTNEQLMGIINRLVVAK